MYQWRLLALTLPTTTLFWSTTSEAMSATDSPVVRPPLPMPVRHTTPPAPTFRMASEITCPTPVHSTTMSGAKPSSAIVPEW